jgi:hypothetical protein
VRIFSASEAAAELGTDGKTLRRFLRQDPSFKNAGSGGRYEFTTADMPKLTEKFNAWHNRPKTSRSVGQPMISDAAGLPHSIVRSRDPRDQARVRQLSQERVDRLEAALKAAGLHISQMRDREGWAPRVPVNA